MEELFELVVTQNDNFLKNFDLRMSSFYNTVVEPNLVVPLRQAMSQSKW